jgi:hypothetical protein
MAADVTKIKDETIRQAVYELDTAKAPLTSPTLVTPTLGVATATSINKVAITAPATSATLTIANGKTLTASNTMTLAGADDTGSITIQAGAQTLVDTKVRASTAVLTKNADTTFAIIPGLTCSLLAGKTYIIKGHLTITASNASGGIKVAIATPDTLTLTSGTITGLNINNATPNATTTATALTTAFGHVTAAVTDVFFEGSVVVNAAGTLEIHAAQNASHASDMTVGVGSTLTVQRVS